MVQIAIRATGHAAIDSLLENRSRAWQVFKVPFTLLLIAGLIFNFLPEFQNDPSEFEGLYFTVYCIMTAVAVVLFRFKWQRFLLQGSEQKTEKLKLTTIVKYGIYWQLFGLPMILAGAVIALGVAWTATETAIPTVAAVFFGVCVYLLFCLAYGVLWRRVALKLPALAVDLERVTVKDAYRLGDGNGGNMVLAVIWAHLYLLIAFAIIGFFVSLIFMASSFLFSGLLGAWAVYLSMVPSMLLQAVAVLVVFGLSASVEAYGFAQLRPEFHPVWERRKKLTAANWRTTDDPGNPDGA